MWFRREKEEQKKGAQFPPLADKGAGTDPVAAPVSVADRRSAEDFVAEFPPGCAGIIMCGPWDLHATTRYYRYPSATALGSRLSEFDPVLEETCTFSMLADRFDEAFVNVRAELRRDEEKWFGRVSVHDHRRLGRALSDRGIPWSPSGNTFVDLITNTKDGPGTLVSSLRKDIHGAAALKRDEALGRVPAVAGRAEVYQRDMLGVDYRSNGLDLRELLVMSDRRLVLITSHARVVGGEEVKLESGSVIEDLGFPQRISYQGDEVVVATTQMASKEVSVSIQGKRLVTGYKSEPREVTLRDPVSAAVLVALVDLGCRNVVEVPAP